MGRDGLLTGEVAAQKFAANRGKTSRNHRDDEGLGA